MSALEAFSGTTANELVFLKGYYNPGDGGEGFFYWNASSTTPDNGGTIIGGFTPGRWYRMFDDFISVKWFGAAGDGTTDDITPINAAILFAGTNSVAGIGKVWIPAGNYAISAPIIQQNGVQVEGEVGQQPQLAGSAQIRTMVTVKAIATMSYMFTNVVNHLRTDQVGLESGNFKSIVNSSISNVTFNGNNLTQWCIYWWECWNGTFSNIRASSSLSYGALFFNTNEGIVNNCNFVGTLLDTVADSIWTANTLSGQADIPALVLRGTTYNTISSGLIFFGLANDSTTIKKIISVDATGLFTIDPSQTNALTTDPGWVLHTGSGAFSWTVATKLITYQAVNVSTIQRIYTSLPGNQVLIDGCQYTLTGTARLLSGSTSGSQSVTFCTGNAGLTYGTANVINGTDYPLNFTFTYNQSSTNPLIITFNGPGLIGTDNWQFQDMKIELISVPVNVNKDPYLFTATGGVLPSSLLGTARLSLGASYYIYFTTGSTFYVASSRANYDAAVAGDSTKWVIPTGADTFTDLSVSPPQAVITLTDATAGNTINGNKIEDVLSSAILLRSVYDNVFSGNTIMKTRMKEGTRLISLEAGSMDNQFTGNTINRRLNTSTDKTAYCIYIDAYSCRNHFSGNRVGNARIIDISDNYGGTQENANRFDSQTFDNVLVFQKKSTDYIATSKGATIPVGIVQPLPTTKAVLNYSEFTLFFKDVSFNDTNASVLFTQDDSASLTASGYVVINKNASGHVEYKIDGTVIVTSATVLTIGQAYDIAIVKLGTKDVQIYIDGVLDAAASAAGYNEAPTTATSISVIGGGFSAQTGSVSIGKFRYYSDSMIAAEVSTLSIAGRYDKMKWNSSNVAVDGSFTTNPQTTFTSSSLLSSIISVAAGVNGAENALQFPQSYTMVLTGGTGTYVVGETVTAPSTSTAIVAAGGTTTMVLSGGSGTYVHGETLTAPSGSTAVVVTGGTTSITVNLTSGAFVIGETVTGGTSGAARTFVSDTTSITVNQVTGSFVGGETVTGVTSGAAMVFASNTILSLSGNAAGTLDRSSIYRVSVWAKSSDLTKVSSLSLSRDSNYTEVYNLTTGYTKIVFYLPPAWLSQTNTLNSTLLRLRGVLDTNDGSQTTYVNSTFGALTLSRFRIDKNGPPLEALFDFAATETASIFANENPNTTMVLSGATGSLIAGEKVTGGTSGATAVIVTGGTNSFVISTNSINGIFQVGETVTGATSTKHGVFVNVSNNKIISKIQSAELPYTETITWTAGTVPNGTTNNTYEWTKVGRLVTLNIILKYATAGATVTEVLCPLPADVPFPVLRSGFANGDYVYAGFGGFATSSTAPIASAARVDLKISSATSATLRGLANSGSFAIFRATVIFWTAS